MVSSSPSKNPAEHRPTQVELLSRERLSDGYCKVDRLTLRFELFAGGMSAPVVRELVERGHAVAVILYDPDLDRCVMIEQFRPGTWAAKMDPWDLEVVAGIIEDGEKPEDVCRRESAEEAAVTVHELEPIFTYTATPGISTETIALYVGRVDSSNAGGVHGLPTEGEDIRVRTMSVDELRWAMETGKAKNSTVLIAIQWMLLNHETLRRRWSTR